MLPHILGILGLAGLSAGWVAVQLLARRLGTKNHFDHAKTCCGLCDAKDCDLEDGVSIEVPVNSVQTQRTSEVVLEGLKV